MRIVFMFFLFATRMVCGMENQSALKAYSFPEKRVFNHPAFSADRQAQFYYNTRFNRFKNYTTVDLGLKFTGLPNIRKFSAFYLYDGSVPTIPDGVSIGFFSMSEDWEFLRGTSLDLLLDDKPLHLGDMDRSGDVGRGYVTESMYLIIPLETFLEIANASKIEIKLFSTEFELSHEQIEALKHYASEIQP